jgi:hypothetical protein
MTLISAPASTHAVSTEMSGLTLYKAKGPLVEYEWREVVQTTKSEPVCMCNLELNSCMYVNGVRPDCEYTRLLIYDARNKRDRTCTCMCGVAPNNCAPRLE